MDDEQGRGVIDFRYTFFFKSLLNEWIALVEKYSDYHFNRDGGFSDDATFWYGERPSTGLLSAAICRAGGISLEEYLSSRKGRKWARADLFFANEHAGFEAEVKKIVLTDTGRQPDETEAIVARLSAAREDAKKLNRAADYRLGVCFVSPRIKRLPREWHRDACERAKSYFDDVLIKCKDEIYGRGKAHAIAWVAPASSRRFSINMHDHRYHYCGQILLLRFVWLPKAD